MSFLPTLLRITLRGSRGGGARPRDVETPAEAVAAGLAGQMAISAEALEEGERLPATQALDRALHLAEFAEASASGAEAFRGRFERG